MSLDTLYPRPVVGRITPRDVAVLLNKSPADTDPVSMVCNGNDFDDSDQAALVVKGNGNVRKVHALLVREGFITEGKGIVG